MVTAASPDSALTRDLDKHDSGGAHNKSGGALIGLEYLVEIKEVTSIISCLSVFFLICVLFLPDWASKQTLHSLFVVQQQRTSFWQCYQPSYIGDPSVELSGGILPYRQQKVLQGVILKSSSSLMFYAHSDQLQLAILENGPSQMLKTHSDQVPNLKLWQAASFQYLQSVVGRIGGFLIIL